MDKRTFFIWQAFGWLSGNLVAYNTLSHIGFLSFSTSSTLILFLLVSTALVVIVATKKKSIALFGAAIVLKWPIVIAVLWWVLRGIQLEGIPLAVGAFIWIPCALIPSLFNGIK